MTVTTVWNSVRRMLRALLISFAVWTLLVVPLMFQAWQGNVNRGVRPEPEAYILHPAIRYAIMAVLTLPIIAFARRFPLRRGMLIRSAVAHLFGFVTFFVVFAWLRYVSLHIFPLRAPDEFLPFLRQLMRLALIEQVWAYGGIVVVGHAIESNRLAREREIEQSRLREEIARQQLQILKLQLHPHFLFNTLHGISSLMDSNIERARTAIAQFSDLLRTALRQTDRDVITLSEELAFVESYLGLEKLRLADRLDYRIRSSGGLAQAIVPTMVLQPLVENAIRHGVEHRRTGGRVEIDADAEGSRLKLRVVNDAANGPNGAGSGVGLRNTHGRLRNLYGSDYELTLRRTAEHRIEVVASFPLRYREEDIGELAS